MDPKEYHLVAVKRILRYLVHTPNLGLWYLKGSRFSLIGYSDVDLPDVKWIGKAPREPANSWVGPLCLGPQRNKIPLPYPQPKRSMLQPVVVVHNYFGCDKL